MKPTTPIERDPARLHEVLPWYVNGTLADEDRSWVEQQLAAKNEQAATDLRVQFDLDRSLAAALERKVAQVPADIGWSSLLQRVRTDAMPDAARKEAAAGTAQGTGPIGGGSGANWMQRLGSLLAPLMSPQLGMGLAVLVAVQAVTIGLLLGGREGGDVDTVEYRTGGDVAPVAAIRALLSETITEKTLREALSTNGATIVDGPNPLGEYWIVVGQGDPEAVAAALRDAGVIASHVIDQRQQRR